MPGSLSAYAERKLLDHFFKVASWTPPTNIYIGLSTADPTDDGTGAAEPAGSAYARTLWNVWDAAATSSGKARSANTGAITFPEATGSWGTLTHFAGFDAITAGNMLFHGPLDDSRAVLSGDVPEFAAGDLDITFEGKMSDAVNEDLLDHLLKVVSMSVPTNLYVALSTADPGANGSTIAEVSGGSYARLLANVWDAAVTAGGLSKVENDANLNFPTASAGWGTITWGALFSAITAGTYYGRFQLTNARAIITGDTPRLKANDCDFTLE